MSVDPTEGRPVPALRRVRVLRGLRWLAAWLPEAGLLHIPPGELGLDQANGLDLRAALAWLKDCANHVLQDRPPAQDARRLSATLDDGLDLVEDLDTWSERLRSGGMAAATPEDLARLEQLAGELVQTATRIRKAARGMNTRWALEAAGQLTMEAAGA